MMVYVMFCEVESDNDDDMDHVGEKVRVVK